MTLDTLTVNQQVIDTSNAEFAIAVSLGIPVKIVLGLLFLSLVTTELGSNVRRTRDVFINHCGEMMHELGADIPQDGELEVNRGLAGHAPDSPDS